jgi:3-methyladenine DNA glycosylase AlkD
VGEDHAAGDDAPDDRAGGFVGDGTIVKRLPVTSAQLPGRPRSGAKVLATGNGQLATLRKDLRSAANSDHAKIALSFFKTAPGQYGEGDRFLGIRVPVLRTFVRKHETLSLQDIESLLDSPWHEERIVALLILVRRYERGEEADRDAIYDLYLRKTARINNWDLVDCSAPQIVGAHLRDRDRAVLYSLAKSSSLWERRIAILATFHYIRGGDFRDALAIAALLLDDRHDLIHKAAGWMLREIGNRDRAVEEKFLRKHSARMPRTMLRYAIEKFPATLRRTYLEIR